MFKYYESFRLVVGVISMQAQSVPEYICHSIEFDFENFVSLLRFSLMMVVVPLKGLGEKSDI